MEPTGWDEQVEALASRVNGEDTEAPLDGLLTVMPSDPPLPPELCAVMATSASQLAPPLPHDLT